MYNIINISTSNFSYFQHFIERIIGTTKLPVNLPVHYTLFLQHGAVHAGSTKCSPPATCISHQFDFLPH